MKGGKKPQGFTIFEVMIVLAVSGVLLIIAARAVSGYQAKAEFTQAIRDVETQILDVANDVSNGYFPGYTNKSCTINGSNEPTISAGSNSQGTNKACTFIGKAIQFREDGKIDIYTIIGNRLKADPDPSLKIDVTSLDQVKATTDVSLIEQKNLLYGMKPYKVSVSVEATCPPYTPPCGSVWNTGIMGTDTDGDVSARPSTIMFITSFGQTGDKGYSVGSTKTKIYVLRNSRSDSVRSGTGPNGKPGIADLLTITGATEKTTGSPTDMDAYYLPVVGGYTICLVKDGRYATLSLASQDNNITTRVLFDEATGCKDA